MRNRFAAAFVGLIYFLALNFCATDSGCSALVIYRRKPKPKLVCEILIIIIERFDFGCQKRVLLYLTIFSNENLGKMKNLGMP